jgi:hypothetical protein
MSIDSLFTVYQLNQGSSALVVLNKKGIAARAGLI